MSKHMPLLFGIAIALVLAGVVIIFAWPTISYLGAACTAMSFVPLVSVFKPFAKGRWFFLGALVVTVILNVVFKTGLPTATSTALMLFMLIKHRNERFV